MIERLAIHRFRGIRQGELEDFGKINVLIGPNNSGKTAILEMLYLIAASGRDFALHSEAIYEKVRDEIDKRKKTEMEGGTETISRNDSDLKHEMVEEPDETIAGFAPEPADFLGRTPWSRIWERHGENPRWEDSPASLTSEKALKWRLDFIPKHHLFRAFRMIPPPGEDLKDIGGFSEDDTKTVASFVLRAKKILPPELLPKSLHSLLADAESNTLFAFSWHPSFIHEIPRNLSVEDNFPLGVWAVRHRNHRPVHSLFFDFHSASGPFTPIFRDMAYMEIPDWYDMIDEALARIYPEELKGCRVDILAGNYIRLPGATPRSVDHFGDGTRHAFKVLCSLIALKEKVSDEKPGLFLWEDPELFMHPSALGALLKEATDLIRDCPIQMFVCTQNKEVLEHFARLTEAESIPSPDFRAFQLQLHKGLLRVQPFIGDTLGVWMEYDMDPRIPEMESEETAISMNGEA
jgi:hypothetical protein